MRRRSWPTSLVASASVLALALAGGSCSTGPHVNYCIPGDPDLLACARSKPMTYREADGWRCLSARDLRVLLRSCRLGVGEPDVDVCTIAWDEPSQQTVAVCSDGRVLAPWDLPNYACLSPHDHERLLLWCRRKQP